MAVRRTRARGGVAEREYGAYALSDIEDPRGDPDVLLDVPVVTVDSIHLELEELDAHVSLLARVLDLVRLSAGVDVHLGRLRVDVKGVEAQALLKVRLERVTAIVDRVLTTIDRNPELVESLGSTLEDVGKGTGHALGETGEAVESVGGGAEGVGSGAEQAVGEIGQGVGRATSGLSGGSEQALGELGETVSGILHGSGAADAGALASGADTKNVAKLASKFIIQELKDAAADEAKGLGLAATRKAIEISERRKLHKAGEHDATPAARREADELGVDIDAIDGTGPDGRITLRDVHHARQGA